MKQRHYVTKWMYNNRVYTDAACGQKVVTIDILVGYRGAKAATYRKNHVKCKKCRRILKLKSVR